MEVTFKTKKDLKEYQNLDVTFTKVIVNCEWNNDCVELNSEEGFDFEFSEESVMILSQSFIDYEIIEEKIVVEIIEDKATIKITIQKENTFC